MRVNNVQGTFDLKKNGQICSPDAGDSLILLEVVHAHVEHVGQARQAQGQVQPGQAAYPRHLSYLTNNWATA
jgi:hypothetical protein